MHLVDYYAQTLLKAAEERSPADFDAFFHNFIALLKKKKHISALPAILRSLRRVLQEREMSNKTIMVVREASLAEEYAGMIKEHAEVFGEEYEVVEDPQIVGGCVVRNRTNILDASYRTRLTKLYGSLVG